MTPLLLVCALLSVLCCWLLPPQAVSAVRTLAVVAIVAILLVRKPLRIGRPRGVTTVFNCLRPAVAVYVISIVVEQLIYTCVAHDAIERGNVRVVVYHGTTIVQKMSVLPNTLEGPHPPNRLNMIEDNVLARVEMASRTAVGVPFHFAFDAPIEIGAASADDTQPVNEMVNAVVGDLRRFFENAVIESTPTRPGVGTEAASVALAAADRGSACGTARTLDESSQAHERRVTKVV